MVSGSNVEWREETKPQLNTWYRCKREDNWFKIIKTGSHGGNALYSIVDYRNGRVINSGLTLHRVRYAIKESTWLRSAEGSNI